MKIVAISDTHGRHREVTLPEGDVLVHAGDALSRGTYDEFLPFCVWMGEVAKNFEHTLYVPGNHDIWVQRNLSLATAMLLDSGVTLLCDAGVSLDDVGFWGSPWTPQFGNWAFMLPRESRELFSKWEKIPVEGVDVLVTHGPPFQILDENEEGRNVGCELLRHQVVEVGPLIHIFGHIHEAHGEETHNGIRFVNAAICDQAYRPVNQPIVVER